MNFILRHRLYYVFFGTIFFVFWFLFKVGGMPDIKKALSSTFIDVALTMITMLITVEFLLPGLIYRNKYRLFLTYFFLLVFFAGTTIIFSQLALHGSSLSAYQKNVARSPEHYFYWFWADLIFGSYFLVFFISATGAATRFAFDRIKAVNTIEKLEKEKVNAELESLKNQINPHFLFNALNTIYYKIERSNTDAKEILQRFSAMLRYQLYECDKEVIPIDKELMFLDSYIELQKERLNDNYEVIYKGFDSIKGFDISPFLLMPLVENCFKYVSDYSNRKNRIFIEVSKENNTFILHTFNTKESKSNNEKGGIGLENVKKRLNLLYPNRYLIDTKTTEDSFEVSLKLKLL